MQSCLHEEGHVFIFIGQDTARGVDEMHCGRAKRRQHRRSLASFHTCAKNHHALRTRQSLSQYACARPYALRLDMVRFAASRCAQVRRGTSAHTACTGLPRLRCTCGIVSADLRSCCGVTTYSPSSSNLNRGRGTLPVATSRCSASISMSPSGLLSCTALGEMNAASPFHRWIVPLFSLRFSPGRLKRCVCPRQNSCWSRCCARSMIASRVRLRTSAHASASAVADESPVRCGRALRSPLPT